MRMPWLISAGALTIAGFLVTAFSHENVPTQAVDLSQPGKIQIQYVQRAPELGKALSLVFAGGIAASLWMALKTVETQIEEVKEMPVNFPAMDVEDEVKPVVAVRPTIAKSRKGFFDFTALQTQPDTFTAFAIVADMGAGKTRLIKHLAKNVLSGSDLTVMDIYARATDWQGATVLTDVEDFVKELDEDLDDIQNLVVQYRNGQSEFDPQLFVIEEAANTLTEAQDQGKNEAKLVKNWLSKYLTVTRKIRKRLCLVSVNIKDLTDAIGSAEKRDSMVFIFPGEKGIAKAMSDIHIFKLGTAENTALRDRLKKSLAGVKRPALVRHRGQWWAAEIPEVNEDGSLIGASTSNVVPIRPQAAIAVGAEDLDDPWA